MISRVQVGNIASGNYTKSITTIEFIIVNSDSFLPFFIVKGKKYLE